MQRWSATSTSERSEPVANASVARRLGRAVPVAGRERLRDHAAVVYWESSELIRAVVPFIDEGLSRGETVLYLADDHPTSLVGKALAQMGVDVKLATARGQLAVVSASDVVGEAGDDAGVASLVGRATRAVLEMTYLFRLGELDRTQLRGPAQGQLFISAFNGNREVTSLLAAALAPHPLLLSNGVPLLNPYFRMTHGKSGASLKRGAR
jgi:hypothetical protein